MSLVDREAIAGMIPHEGAMCLLDGVLCWDQVSVRCLSRRYAQPDNPLRRPDGKLGAACGIEIAAQAMAVHGRLVVGSGRPRQGYLMSVRDVRLCPGYLDAAPGDLMAEAERLSDNGGAVQYRFALTRHGILLLSGRASVLLDVPA